jgi:sterol desaturase/sphingolipid hydroxylase (fatty acid hydroxylase superfamily)
MHLGVSMTEFADFLQQAPDLFLQLLSILVTKPITGNSHLYWPFLISTVGLALISYTVYENKERFSLLKALRFCFPKKIYLHPSAIVDYKLFVANAFLVPMLALLTNVIYLWVAQPTTDLLAGYFGPNPYPPPKGGLTFVLFTITMALFVDLGTFVTHTLHHRIPFLWSYHRVHHTAEVLTPLTLYRKHPFYETLGHICFAPIDGALRAVIFYLFFGYYSPIMFLSANVLMTLFRFMGANLGHSHIWVSWGPFFNRIVMSPAMHQIHHSADPRHINKNLGEVFVIWDWIFGSLYIPRRKEDLTFGIGGAPQEHPSLRDAYLAPIRDSVRIVRGWFGRKV